MGAEQRWLFAASTLGVVDESLEATVAALQRHGVQAAELRSADGAFVHPALPHPERAAVREMFDAAGIEVVAVASRVEIAAVGDDDEAVRSLVGELRLAADLGASYVRVFPGAPALPVSSDRAPQLEEDATVVDSRAVRRLLAVQEVAAELQVRPVVETHDSHPRGADVARILRRLDADAPGHLVGAVWDVLHPWRVGESLDVTAEALLPYLTQGRGYVQIKDVASPADTVPVLQGQGTVPVPDFLTILDDAAYRGPVSLEWERFWQPQVPPLDEALGAAARALATQPPAA